MHAHGELGAVTAYGGAGVPETFVLRLLVVKLSITSTVLKLYLLTSSLHNSSTPTHDDEINSTYTIVRDSVGLPDTSVERVVASLKAYSGKEWCDIGC